MKVAKKALTVVAAVPLLAILAVVLTPKATHAVVATLVQITNTRSNPVPNVDVNNPAEEPFQTILCSQIGTPQNPCAPFHIPEKFTVPNVTPDGSQVKRLVVEQTSGVCFSNKLARLQYVVVEGLDIADNQVALVVASPTQTPDLAGDATFSIPAHVYLDPGDTLGVAIQDFEPNSGGGFNCTIAVVGYYVRK